MPVDITLEVLWNDTPSNPMPQSGWFQLLDIVDVREYRPVVGVPGMPRTILVHVLNASSNDLQGTIDFFKRVFGTEKSNYYVDQTIPQQFIDQINVDRQIEIAWNTVRPYLISKELGREVRNTDLP